ncbi:hypothetical protein Tco_0000150 [Tanacetum coccineum]
MPAKRTTTHMIDVAIKALIAQGVATALAEYEANRGNGNGDDSHDSRSGRRTERAARECTYNNFLKCQPFNFKGTEGVVGLTQWFEKMESVFHISNCTIRNKIKFATCTLLGSALTWWNTHVKMVGHDAAYGMTWKTLMKMLTDNYTQRFQELALICGKMFPEESDQVKIYVGGLPDMIQGSLMASKPKTMQEAIEIANDLMDQKVRAYAEKQAENKRKFDNNNQAQQQPPKKQSVAIAYTAGSGERNEYVVTLPLCNKCKFHHNGLCIVKCVNCNRVGGDCPDQRIRTMETAGVLNTGMVYMPRGGETDQDLDNMEDDINA